MERSEELRVKKEGCNHRKKGRKKGAKEKAKRKD
jgi:hypothetical protein